MGQGMKLTYITREMADPRGRPKVFFSCHPADFAGSFELVTKDILQHANCAIWYDAELVQDADAPRDHQVEGELLEALDDMQLAVFAVTARFLEEPNRARDVELPHVLEQHIPVLPIMLESGLEYEFNEKCAPVQVVNRNVSDPTATPYDEVLQTFLSSTLVGDELAAKVRDAFDAYVFLSYRKKDRRHAQRLMHLIHENEAFRDIAIWYDEYLVPGEGFDAAIEAAFLKSSLFALAVTPNLLEEGNYVKEVEFPLARDRKNREGDLEIVPVEMYDPNQGDPRTDLEALAGEYAEIPPVQDEHVTVKLNEAFVTALERVGKKENDGSAQHRFFIGLAYLNGIDVEVNHERALDLIRQAATAEGEEPCIDATEKLVDMYLTGDGVAPDVREAIRWQQQVVSQYGDAYRKHHDPDEHRGFGTKRFKALMRLSDMLRDVGERAAAIDAAERALEVARELTGEVGVREVERDQAIILNRLGGLYRRGGDLHRALDCYKQAKRIYAKLADEIGTARARRDLSVSYERIGDVLCKQGDLADAEEHYRKAHDIRRRLAEADPSPRTWRDLSAILTKLGNVLRDGEDLEGALDFYSQALERDHLLAEELRTSQAIDDCAVSLIKVGDVMRKLGELDKAIEYYETAEALYADLIEHAGSLRYRKNHARCLVKLASACKHASASDRARRCYEQAVSEFGDIYSAVGGDSDESAHELAAAHLNFALFKHDSEEARKAVEIWERLVARNPKYGRYLEKARKVLG